MDATDRSAQRLHLALPAQAWDALIASAVREDRPTKAQAARYIVAGLRRDGYLADDPDTLAAAGAPETWIGARPVEP
jgi:hypothetical protein